MESFLFLFCVFVYTFLRKLGFRSIIDLELSSMHGKLRFEKSEMKFERLLDLVNLRISVHIGIFMYWSIKNT